MWATVGLVVLLTIAYAESVITCGGQVSISPSILKFAPPDFDYSLIKVTVLTKSGLQKDSVYCAPNGFYSALIYESGSFILRVEHPNQWSFEPAEVEFTANEYDQFCEGDINFRLTGFPIHGSINAPQLPSCRAQYSPASQSLNVILRSSSTGKTKELSIRTESNGEFMLKGIRPDNYTIEAVHPSGITSRPHLEHSVAWGESNLDPFNIPGATISGVVKSDISAKGVGVIIVPSGASRDDCSFGDRTCYFVVSDDGHFSYQDVACGLYDLHIDVSRSAVTYSLNRNMAPIEVSFEPLQLSSETFIITGINVAGYVRDPLTNEGIADAYVFVDGVQTAITDNDGLYVWSAANSGDKGFHNINVLKKGYSFSSLPPYVIGAAVPDVVVESYDICGHVSVSGIASSDHNIEVVANGVVVASVNIDHRGLFCYAAKPGEVILRPSKSLGLLSPLSRRVTVTNAPIDNVDFYQIAVSVKGQVVCFDTLSCQSVSLSLHSKKGSVLTTTVSAVNTFEFPEVTPGEYELRADAVGACFGSVPVKVEAEDVADITISQKGVLIDVLTSYSSDMRVSGGDDSFTISLEPGSSSFCIASDVPGRYTLDALPESAISFEGVPMPIVHGSPIQLKLDKIKVTGTVILPSRLSMHPSLTITCSSFQEVVKSDFISVSGDVATYGYSFWSPLGQKCSIRVSEYNDIVFTPDPQQVDIPSNWNKKPITVTAIVGRAGLFRTGKISPVIPDAKVYAYLTPDGDHAADSHRDSAPIEVAVSSTGQYKFGPFSSAGGYTIKVHHPDYKFEPVGNGDFEAVQYSSLEAQITDIVSGAPIEGVLVSLSSTNYRNNSLTSSNGVVQFKSLSASQYFLHVLLKEYIFRPSSHSVRLDQGQKLSFKFAAERVAYSIFGSVKSISGHPLPNIVVKATVDGDDGWVESVSNADGSYRIRGLTPGKDYSVSLNCGEVTDALERAQPAQHHVHMPAADVKDVNFIAYRQPSYADLFGVLPPGSAFTSVVLKHHETGDIKETVHCSPSKRFFLFADVPFGQYTVTAITNGLSSNPFPVAVHGPVSIALPSDPVLPPPVHPAQGSSVFTILIGFVMVLCLVNYEVIQANIKKLKSRRQSSSSDPASWDVQLQKRRNSRQTR